MHPQPTTPARLLFLPVLPCDHCGNPIAPHRGALVCGKCRRRVSAQKARLHQIQSKKEPTDE